MTNYHIFIDGSYCVFFRLFALVNWWKLSHPDETDTNYNLNEEFINRFKEIFVTKLREIPKKLNIPIKNKENIHFYIGKDCPQETIWRKNLYVDYKANRLEQRINKQYISSFFSIVYGEKLFEQLLDSYPTCKILEHEHLEADDCIAIAVTEMINSNPYDEFYIITSDCDYLQLAQQRLQIFDLKYKSLLSKMDFECPKRQLLYKIILGDKSDNIPSVFPKCGHVTTMKYCKNVELFETRLCEKSEYENRFKLNRQLIDFNQIPSELKESFLDKYFE